MAVSEPAGARRDVITFADATYLIGILCVLCLPLVFLLRRPRAVRRT
jgi:hypothetical protein